MVTLTLVVTLAGSEHRPSRCEVAAWHPSEENVRHADLEDAGVGKSESLHSSVQLQVQPAPPL